MQPISRGFLAFLDIQPAGKEKPAWKEDPGPVRSPLMLPLRDGVTLAYKNLHEKVIPSKNLRLAVVPLYQDFLSKGKY